MNRTKGEITWMRGGGGRNIVLFDFIECFTTTFLRAHSWLNWVDEDDNEDEVGLKEKSEDTRYIKNITNIVVLRQSPGEK